MAIRVGVFGAGGKMGSTVCRAVLEDDELELVAAVDPHYEGIDLRTVSGADTDLRVSGDPTVFERSDVQVAIDFTTKEVSRQNLLWLARRGMHAVVGTTGFSDEDLETFSAEFVRSNCVMACSLPLS